MRFTVLIAALAGCAAAQTPSVQEIMARVAENQAKTIEARRSYVYDQEQLLRLKRGGGKLAREERVSYTVVPSKDGIKKNLVKCEGKYESHGRYVSFSQPGYHYKGVDLDAELMKEFEDSTGESKAVDGISRDYFPLTASQQEKYNFTLEGTEDVRGRAAYRVRFEPRGKAGLFDADDDDGDGMWKGVALIDAEEYQPVSVNTDLAAKIPTAVKILLGTNIRGLGFSISYERMQDGVWFPVSFGGEFEIRGLFLYKRTFTVSLVNENFRHTDVNSTVAYAPVQ